MARAGVVELHLFSGSLTAGLTPSPSSDNEAWRSEDKSTLITVRRTSYHPQVPRA